MIKKMFVFLVFLWPIMLVGQVINNKYNIQITIQDTNSKLNINSKEVKFKDLSKKNLDWLLDEKGYLKHGFATSNEPFNGQDSVIKIPKETIKYRTIGIFANSFYPDSFGEKINILYFHFRNEYDNFENVKINDLSFSSKTHLDSLLKDIQFNVYYNKNKSDLNKTSPKVTLEIEKCEIQLHFNEENNLYLLLFVTNEW